MKDELAKLTSVIKDVPLPKMRVSTNAQRELRPARVAYLVSEFNPEDFGYPTVNSRDGSFYIIDGQHRIEAVKQWLGPAWEKQNVTCRVYSGLSEKEEAEMFDRLNNQLTPNAFDKFKVRVTAGRHIECSVKKVVEKAGLKISREKGEGNLQSVATLVKVYQRSNAQTLGRSLKITHESFGDPGLQNMVIDGVARLCERYNGALEDQEAIEKLQSLRGGVGALMSRAELLRKQTGSSLPECVAAATVDTINRRRGGKKLPSWWKE